MMIFDFYKACDVLMKKKLNLMNYSTFYLTFLCPGVKEKDKPDNDYFFCLSILWVSLVYFLCIR